MIALGRMETIMAGRAREKFATQVNPDVLASIREIAKAEGRQLQALVDEALTDLVEKRKRSAPRRHIVTAYQSSHARFAILYKKLAE